MKTLTNVMHVKVGLPSPEWLLKPGALLIRTETELILKSRWVLPDRLLNAGYTFTYPYLQQALEAIVGKTIKKEISSVVI